jgi:hypothetical protein
MPVACERTWHGRADHVGGALLTSGGSAHELFPKEPNQPEDDRECGTHRADLSISARIQKSQSASPLICGCECEANGTKQDKRAGHRADLL